MTAGRGEVSDYGTWGGVCVGRGEVCDYGTCGGV